MFCSNCGSELAEGAVFCHQCGAKVNGAANTVQRNQIDTSKGLEREALRIYLSDVLALECIVNQFSKRASQLNNDISWIERNNYSQAYMLSNINYHAYFLYDGNNFGVLTTERGDRIERSNCYDDTVWTRAEDILKIINVNNTWEEFVPCTYGIFEAKKKRKMFKEQFLDAYADFKRKAPAGYQMNLEKVSEMNHKHKMLCKEWDEAKSLLQKFYQVNIIPESFRNDLYAIFYLHNFVTTSNMSFETALLHYNLEEIKAKLDTIIKQQQEIIINQAITIAQNKTICEQNQRQLEKLSNIESNSYYAAQYAEIAAKNAEAAAWIGLANYIGK
jgi:hypothetical protein